MQIQSRLVAGVVSLGLSALALGFQGPPPAQVRVDTVRLEEVQQRRRVTGEVRPVQRSFVAAREAGLVMQLNVRAGSRVTSGDVLARLDGSRIELSLVTLNAQEAAAIVTVDRRREEADQAHRDVETTRELAEKKTVGRKLLVDMTSAARVADILLAEAQSQLEVLGAQRMELDRQLTNMELRAPFTGVVVDKLSEVGQWLAVGEALVELVSDDQLEVWLDIPQNYAGALYGDNGAGARIDVHVDALDRDLELGGGRSVPQVDERARTFSFVLGVPLGRVADSFGAVTAGMSVSADVPTGVRAEHWTVARDALLRGETESYIYVARSQAGDGPEAPARAARVAVVELFRVGGRVVVQSGDLKAGDVAVVEGNERLYPGAAVLANPPPSGGAER